MPFSPFHNASWIGSVGATDVNIGPLASGPHDVLIDNRGTAPLLVGLGGSPGESTAINIDADSVGQFRISAGTTLVLRRMSGGPVGTVSVTPGREVS